MDVDITKRRQVLATANQEIVDLHADLELGGAIGTYARTLCFSKARQYTFTHIIGDIILGLIPSTEFTPRVIRDIEITKEKAEEMYRTFEPFFKKADRARAGTSTIPEANNALKEKLELHPDTEISTATYADTDAVVPPLTRENILEALSAKRTMQTDISMVKHDKNPVRWESEKR